MAGEIAFESRIPWNPTRPNTTIISCVDGRWFHHFQEFAREHLGAGTRTDTSVVGEPAQPCVGAKFTVISAPAGTAAYSDSVWAEA